MTVTGPGVPPMSERRSASFVAASLLVVVVVALAAIAVTGTAGATVPTGSADATDSADVTGYAAIDANGADGVVHQANVSRLVSGSPELDAYLSRPTVSAGGESTVTVDLLNVGDMRRGNDLDPRVTTARSLRLEAEADDVPIEVTTGEVAVGDVPTGTPTSVPIDVTVPGDVEDGAYEIDVYVRYQYTARIRPGSDTHIDRPGSERFEVTVVVDDGAQFAILDAETDAQIGGGGDVRATIRNVGDEVARDAVVSGSTAGTGVTLGTDGSSDVFVGDWEPGENRTVAFDSTVAPEFAGGAYVLRSTVEYRDADGVETTAPSARTGVTPIREQSFAIDGVEGDLEVGYSGTVSGTISNDGPLAVDDAVLVAEPQSTRVTLGESRYALPELAAGESTDFAFDADVNGGADPGPRQVRFTVEYTSNDATITDETTDRIVVDPRRPEFDVTADGATIPAGETRRITFEITNQRPETLSSINAGLYADSPLSTVNDEAFVDELAPGESTEIWFEVAATDAAGVETHPVELDFRYDDERGNDRISDVTQYPVEVTELVDDGGDLPVGPIVAGVAVLVAVAVAVVRRRRDG